MPTPLATAGRDTSWVADTWQSLIASQSARPMERCQPAKGLACLLDVQSLPSMIDDSRSDVQGIRARTARRSGPVPDCLRRAASALAGDFLPVTAR